MIDGGCCGGSDRSINPSSGWRVVDVRRTTVRRLESRIKLFSGSPTAPRQRSRPSRLVHQAARKYFVLAAGATKSRTMQTSSSRQHLVFPNLRFSPATLDCCILDRHTYILHHGARNTSRGLLEAADHEVYAARSSIDLVTRL